VTSSTKTMAKNFSVMFVSQVVTWALAFIQTSYMTRALGPSVSGTIFFAWSVWVLAMTFATFGMDIFLNKQVALHPDHVSTLLGSSLMVRSLFYLLGCLGMTVYLWTQHDGRELALVVGLIGVANYFILQSNALTAVLQGLELMEFVSIASVLSKLVGAVLTIGLLWLGYGMYMVANVAIVSAVVGFLIQLAAIRKRYPISWKWDTAVCKQLILGGSAYVVMAFAIVVYQQIDAVSLKHFVSREVIGWYGAANTYFSTLMFVPVVFGSVVFPSLVRTYERDPSHFGPAAAKSFDLMIMAGIPIGFGLSVLAGPVILLVNGPAYSPAIPILALLGLVLIFTYLSTFFAYLAIISKRSHIWAWVMVISVVLKIVLNIVLIPWCQARFGNGGIGSALSYLVTEGGMVAAGILMMPKQTFAWENLRKLVLIVAVGCLMYFVCWMLSDMVIVVPIIAGAAVYLCLILGLRIVPAEDLKLLRDTFERIVARLRGAKPKLSNLQGE
jgi:O-antigen/teichoic acid export membrane protein